MVACVGFSIRPLEEADNTGVSVVVEERVGRGEEYHRQREAETYHPNTDRDAYCHHLAHPRSQWVHDRHVPLKSIR